LATLLNRLAAAVIPANSSSPPTIEGTANEPSWNSRGWISISSFLK